MHITHAAVRTRVEEATGIGSGAKTLVRPRAAMALLKSIACWAWSGGMRGESMWIDWRSGVAGERKEGE